MIEFIKNTAIILPLSIFGTFGVVLGSLIAAIAYRGKLGERYSPFNHFISELGERGVSRLSWSFNLGLVICGICLLPAVISLGMMIHTFFAWLGMAAGIVAAISLALVGFFPMDNITPHIRSAVTYFRSGLAMVLFFTLAIAFPSDDGGTLPRILSLAGIPAIIAFAFFLVYSQVNLNTRDNALSPLETTRPRFWVLAISEWVIFITTVPWLLAIGLGI